MTIKLMEGHVLVNPERILPQNLGERKICAKFVPQCTVNSTYRFVKLYCKRLWEWCLNFERKQVGPFYTKTPLRICHGSWSASWRIAAYWIQDTHFIQRTSRLQASLKRKQTSEEDVWIRGHWDKKEPVKRSSFDGLRGSFVPPFERCMKYLAKEKRTLLCVIRLQSSSYFIYISFFTSIPKIFCLTSR